MLSWFNEQDKEKEKGLLDDTFTTTQNYVILTKMKYFEEQVGDHTNKIYKLELQNHELKAQNQRLIKNVMSLNARLEEVERKLNTCVILEPNTPDIIVKR